MREMAECVRQYHRVAEERRALIEERWQAGLKEAMSRGVFAQFQTLMNVQIDSVGERLAVAQHSLNGIENVRRALERMCEEVSTCHKQQEARLSDLQLQKHEQYYACCRTHYQALQKWHQHKAKKLDLVENMLSSLVELIRVFNEMDDPKCDDFLAAHLKFSVIHTELCKELEELETKMQDLDVNSRMSRVILDEHNVEYATLDAPAKHARNSKPTDALLPVPALPAVSTANAPPVHRALAVHQGPPGRAMRPASAPPTVTVKPTQTQLLGGSPLLPRGSEFPRPRLPPTSAYAPAHFAAADAKAAAVAPDDPPLPPQSALAAMSLTNASSRDQPGVAFQKRPAPHRATLSQFVSTPKAQRRPMSAAARIT
eukprot:NODE_211_length_2302_cov_44.739770_g205_i0.p1 GENE.NODE_211_length_2302_cov_44.739770_g205_i0~~NODE_211_length_2302_cov_44.739770_g205_i0.p1  ORF type:complete len:371 (+),score=65.30 NODE_211_length_2302_cov_44.739770_g205_i0:1169-2281(+)